MPCSDERLRPPKVRKLGSSGASGKQRPSRSRVRNAHGGDDHAAPEMCYLVIEAHQLCVGLLRHRSVHEAAIDEVFNEGQGPASFDAEFRSWQPPRKRDRRSRECSQAPMQQQPGLDSLPSEDFLHLRRSRSSAATSGTHTTGLAFYAPHPLFDLSAPWLFAALPEHETLTPRRELSTNRERFDNCQRRGKARDGLQRGHMI